MSNENVKPFVFVNFDEEDVNSEDPLIKFKIDRPKNFIPEFKVDSKYDFKPLFSEKGELTKEGYRRKVEDFYENKKKEIEKKLNKYFEEKKKEADKIVENARKEEKNIKEKAYNEGFEKGYNEGFKKGEDDLKNFISDFLSLTEKLKEFEKEFIIAHEENIAKIILKIVKKIIKTELKSNSEEILISNLKEIFRKIVDKGYIEIKVNEQDYEIIEKYLKKIKEIEDVKELNLTKSEDLDRGDCVVETNYGTYDARIDEQIDEIYKILRTK